MSERRVPGPAVESPLLAHLLAALAPMNRTRVKQLLQHGQVRVNGAAITRHDHPVRPADAITISNEPVRTGRGLILLHQDDSIVAIDKPCGLLTVATDTEKDDTAFVRLAGRLGERPHVVHRLDRETSGVLLFARSAAVRDRIQANWESVEKFYLAVVEGTPKEPHGTIESHLLEGDNMRVRVGRPGGAAKHAVTHYKVIAEHGGFSLLEVKLGTGRKHQIRVHLASLGCPVIGDPDYGARTNPARRLGLHAWKVVLPSIVVRHSVAGGAGVHGENKNTPLGSSSATGTPRHGVADYDVIEAPYPAALNHVVRSPSLLTPGQVE